MAVSKTQKKGRGRPKGSTNKSKSANEYQDDFKQQQIKGFQSLTPVQKHQVFVLIDALGDVLADFNSQEDLKYHDLVKLDKAAMNFHELFCHRD